MDERNYLCPNCQTLLVVPVEYWRKEMRCEECGKTFTPNETNLQHIAAHVTAGGPSPPLSDRRPENPSSKSLYFFADGKNVEGPIPASQVMHRVSNGMQTEKVLVTVQGEPENWVPFSKTPYFHAAFTAVSAEREVAKIAKTTESTAEDGKPDGCQSCILLIIFMVVLMFIVAVIIPPTPTPPPPRPKSLNEIMTSGKPAHERDKEIEKWLRQNRPDLFRKN